MINLPVFVIMFGCIGICTYYGIPHNWPWWLVTAGCTLGFVLGWLWWSIFITKWRIWAFEHVNNIHALQQQAVLKNLIWPEGSFFERTEIRTAEERERIRIIQARLQGGEEEIEDDTELGSETAIYYSKPKNFFQMAFGLAALVIGVYLYISEERKILAGIAIVYGLIVSYREFMQATNKEAQLVISTRGIQIGSDKFYEWRVIRNEEVVIDNSGKKTDCYLRFDCGDDNEEINVMDYDISEERLAELLRIYRLRSKRK